MEGRLGDVHLSGRFFLGQAQKVLEPHGFYFVVTQDDFFELHHADACGLEVGDTWKKSYVSWKGRSSCHFTSIVRNRCPAPNMNIYS